MLIDLAKLINGTSNSIAIDNDINIDKSYLEGSDVKDISTIHVTGDIRPFNDNFEVNLNIKCTLVLIGSISLNDVNYDIDIEISEIIGENSVKFEENNKIINNSIDLIPIIWQNIILEVPLKVIDPNFEAKNINGDGWRFVTEEKDIKSENSQFKEKLEQFLSEQREE